MTEEDSLDALLKKCALSECSECHGAITLENIGWNPQPEGGTGDVFPVVSIVCKVCTRLLRTIHVRTFATSPADAVQKANEALA